MSLLSLNTTLHDLCKLHLPALAANEQLSKECILAALENGSMVLLGNPAHPGLTPILVGRPAKVKVNANVGTSPLCNFVPAEMEKIAVALAAGADTVMDLSIAGDLAEIRSSMLRACPKPLGTVPLYAAVQKYIEAGEEPAKLSVEELFEEIECQAEQGVDFMTVHCGITERAAAWASEENGRIMGIVSRGGAILTQWMQKNKQENPLLTDFNRILRIAKKHNVTLSLGDGLRPGAVADAGDAAQWEEVIMLSRLARTALAAGVQCMIEGPGHVPLHEVQAQIKGIKKACSGAPLYVLGPLVTDICPGYDHIAGAIGAALAVQAGVDFLCYLTPAEHLTLPDKNDVKAGVVASRIAAQAGEAALGDARALVKEECMAKARKNLDWKSMQELAIDPCMVALRRKDHVKEEVCAMCGEFCAVKLLRK